MITLVSNDAREYVVSRRVAEQSATIQGLLEDTDDASSPVPLPSVTGPVLGHVLQWCTQCVACKDGITADGKDDTDKTKTDAVQTAMEEWWRTDFARQHVQEQRDLFDVVLAANYLDIKSLLHAACKAVAEQIKGKSVEQLRATFGIVNDFTPEEEEQVRKENEWCEER